MLRLYLIALLALGAAGCATLEEPFRAHEESSSPEVRQCAGWYSALDREVTNAGVRDAQDARPMGIDSAGAMRQWGRHATAFVGRQHFDDADLFEKRFRFDLP